jgi:hypothetical protein
MGNLFNNRSDGSKNRSIVRQTAFEKACATLPEADRLRLMQIIQIYGLNPDDPLFAILGSHATIAQALLDAPEQNREVMLKTHREMLAQLSLYLNKVKEQSIREQESAIVKSVARVLQYAQSRAELKTWKDIVVPMTIMVTILFGSGMASGWFSAAYLSPKPSPIAPGQPVKLTERQVETLKLLEKSDGQVALDIVKYNPGKIDECLQSQSEILKKSIALPTLGKVEYGACVLWLVPTEKRRFSQ